MTGERRYLRLVKNQSPETPEQMPAFDWQQFPQSLREIAQITNAVWQAAGNLPTNPELATSIEIALNNIDSALREEVIGTEIDHHSVAQNLAPLAASFETLQKTLAVPLFDIELQSLTDEVLHNIFSRIIELATRRYRNLTMPNPAFRYVLLMYRAYPTYADMIEDQLPQPREMEYGASWEQRSQEQAELETVGNKLRGTRNTADLVKRLNDIILPSRRLYFNPTLFQRRPVFDGRSIVEMILLEVQKKGISSLATAETLRESGVAPQDLATARLPLIGSFSTAAVVIPEIEHEKETWDWFIQKNERPPTLQDCQSWMHVMWYIYDTIEPKQEFAALVTNTDGVEEVERFSGRDIQIITENSSLDRTLMENLPGENFICALKPGSELLPLLRQKLEHFLQ